VSSLQHANQQHDDHFEIPSFDMLYEQFNDMLQHKEVLLNAFHHAHTAVAVIALKPLLNFVSLASMALQFVFKSLVFFTLLMSLLAGKTDVLTKVFEMIPLSDTQRGLDALRESLEACFFLPFRIASSHAMIAIVTFHIFAADLPYVLHLERMLPHS
jgi:predicted PurR-regulated permease PerM